MPVCRISAIVDATARNFEALACRWRCRWWASWCFSVRTGTNRTMHFYGNWQRAGATEHLIEYRTSTLSMKNSTFAIAAVPLLWCAAAVHRPVTVPAAANLATGSRISVVTLNMAKETDGGRIVAELRANPVLRDADVLLLQEVK